MSDQLQQGFEAGKYKVRTAEEVQKDLQECQDRIYEMIHNLPCALIQYMLDPIIRSTKTFKLFFELIGGLTAAVEKIAEAVEVALPIELVNPMSGTASTSGVLASGGIPPAGESDSSGGASEATALAKWSGLRSGWKYDETKYPKSQGWEARFWYQGSGNFGEASFDPAYQFGKTITAVGGQTSDLILFTLSPKLEIISTRSLSDDKETAKNFAKSQVYMDGKGGRTNIVYLVYFNPPQSEKTSEEE